MVAAVPGKLPPPVARLNPARHNPTPRQYAWLLPPWALVLHRGRRSGRLYRTPVNAYVRRGTFAVVMLYGTESDWVRNLLAAGSGQVVRGGRTYELISPRVLDAADAPSKVP